MRIEGECDTKLVPCQEERPLSNAKKIDLSWKEHAIYSNWDILAAVRHRWV